MNTFKLRAECIEDIREFHVRLAAASIRVGRWDMLRSDIRLPDTELVFSADGSLDQIKIAAGRVRDGHVMVETVALEHKYTGIRP